MPSFFSTNAICRQYNCINPVFPGLDDLMRLEATTYQCQPLTAAKPYMQFCKDAVYYNIAVPSPNATANVTTLAEVVTAQDRAAATSYFYHLSGMKVDGWEHTNPARDECTQAIWKMACHTYFPRAAAGCQQGEVTAFLRPCKNVCGSYIQACAVECCDESVQCNFEREVSLLDGTTRTFTGYSNEVGPSALCTGGALRSSSPGGAWFLAVLLGLSHWLLTGFGRSSSTSAAKAPRAPGWGRAWRRPLVVAAVAVAAVGLQGCGVDEVLAHEMPKWQQKPSYWVDFQYIPEGKPVREAVLNSCDVNGLSKEKQCNGNGECVVWRPNMTLAAYMTPTRFCQCNRDWADPECRTRRKSQMTAYFLSIFLGYLGVDHFYLMQYYSGFAKLATAGGLGVWWLVDIVRIGSAPIYAYEHRLAYDLPHWLYVQFTVLFFTLFGYFLFGCVAEVYRKEKYMKKMLHEEEEAIKHMRGAPVKIRMEDKIGMPTYGSYAVPLVHEPNVGQAPDWLESSAFQNPYSPMAIARNAMGAWRPSGKYDSHARPLDPQAFAAAAANPLGSTGSMAPPGSGMPHGVPMGNLPGPQMAEGAPHGSMHH